MLTLSMSYNDLVNPTHKNLGINFISNFNFHIPFITLVDVQREIIDYDSRSAILDACQFSLSPATLSRVFVI